MLVPFCGAWLICHDIFCPDIYGLGVFHHCMCKCMGSVYDYKEHEFKDGCRFCHNVKLNY